MTILFIEVKIIKRLENNFFIGIIFVIEHEALLKLLEDNIALLERLLFEIRCQWRNTYHVYDTVNQEKFAEVNLFFPQL